MFVTPNYNYKLIKDSLTNEVKTKSADQCLSEFMDILNQCKDKWPAAKLVISLGTPRLDGKNSKINILNALLKEKFEDESNIFLCDHSNMAHRGSPLNKFLIEDKVHLSKAGTAVLAANLKSSICASLGIRIFRRPKNNNSYNFQGKGQQRPRRFNRQRDGRSSDVKHE